ncbi:MAG: hypothetical protein HYU66_11325 [Armatimonadetes bacterium]|nr:hypothetical protein [Armatimonadota bacterium]
MAVAASTLVPALKADDLPGVTATTPSLTGIPLWLPLRQADCMERARRALVAAKLTLHDPATIDGGGARGGANEHVFAIITCVRTTDADDKTFVLASAAGGPGWQNDAVKMAWFLGDFMKTGKAPDPAAEPHGGPFDGTWRMETDGWKGSLRLAQADGRVTGSYEYDGGAQYPGTVDGIADGHRLRFRWKGINGSKGSGTLVLSDDGTRFEGWWSRSDDFDKHQGTWNGTR